MSVKKNLLPTLDMKKVTGFQKSFKISFTKYFWLKNTEFLISPFFHCTCTAKVTKETYMSYLKNNVEYLFSMRKDTSKTFTKRYMCPVKIDCTNYK